ncbi:hypothetical protein KUTeg_009122 [Tegillarca granosa]|uniref:C1q domain-containing protein n=1 Tax=Tegillarca granosa TaxID=220873 RepID=A0ABQ9F9Q6_TEGGR|nr:hypothetical protein KUTeg_009122 [Tegillarca granosa]
MLVFWIFLTSFVVNVVKLQDGEGNKWAVDVEERMRKTEESIEELTEHIKTLNTRIKLQETIIKSQITEIKNLKSLTVQFYKPSRNVKSIEADVSDSPIGRNIEVVAFSSRLTTSLGGLGQHQTVKFNQIVTNEGNAYDKVLGMFIAPVTGLYVFTWTISTKNGKWQSTELVKEGTAYGYSMVDSSFQPSSYGSNPDYITASNTVVLQVEANQRVWIRTGNQGEGFLDAQKAQIMPKRLVDIVAFSSRLTAPITGLGHHQTIIFNHVVSNEGNGYKANAGVFVAPVQDLYVFTRTISTNDLKWQVTKSVKDGFAYGYSVADGSVKMHVNGVNPDYTSATNTVVLQFFGQLNSILFLSHSTLLMVKMVFGHGSPNTVFVAGRVHDDSPWQALLNSREVSASHDVVRMEGWGQTSSPADRP